MKFSNQAIGCLLMTLQKCLAEQSDITETLRGFDLAINDEQELVITNPPVVEFDNEDA